MQWKLLRFLQLLLKRFDLLILWTWSLFRRIIANDNVEGRISNAQMAKNKTIILKFSDWIHSTTWLLISIRCYCVDWVLLVKFVSHRRLREKIKLREAWAETCSSTPLDQFMNPYKHIAQFTYSLPYTSKETKFNSSTYLTRSHELLRGTARSLKLYFSSKFHCTTFRRSVRSSRKNAERNTSATVNVI